MPAAALEPPVCTSPTQPHLSLATFTRTQTTTPKPPNPKPPNPKPSTPPPTPCPPPCRATPPRNPQDTYVISDVLRWLQGFRPLPPGRVQALQGSSLGAACLSNVAVQRAGFPAEALQALRFLLASDAEAAAGACVGCSGGAVVGWESRVCGRGGCGRVRLPFISPRAGPPSLAVRKPATPAS